MYEANESLAYLIILPFIFPSFKDVLMIATKPFLNARLIDERIISVKDLIIFH